MPLPLPSPAPVTLVYRLGIFYPEAKCGIYNLSGIKVCDNAKLALPRPLPLLQPETCRASKTFYTQAGAGQKRGVLAPKGACRQVKSVTENEPRVACKFDIEATPDMPKRIRQAGGRGAYEPRGGEGERST